VLGYSAVVWLAVWLLEVYSLAVWEVVWDVLVIIDIIHTGVN